MSSPSDDSEVEARAMADRQVSGGAVPSIDGRSVAIARDELDGGLPIAGVPEPARADALDSGVPEDHSTELTNHGAQPPAAMADHKPISRPLVIEPPTTQPSTMTGSEAGGGPSDAVVRSAAVCPWPTLLQPIGLSCPSPSAAGLMLATTVKVAPPLPEFKPAPFGDDTAMATFVATLARTHAARTVAVEVESRYQAARKSAAIEADQAGKADRDASITEAEANARHANSDPKRLGLEVARARAAAGRDAGTRARATKTAALATVTHPNLTVVATELATAKLSQLESDLRHMMAEGIVEQVKPLQDSARVKLDKLRMAKRAQLSARPKVARDHTAPPPRSKDEVDADLDAYMQERWCEEEAAMWTRFEKLKYAWAVGRREELDFKTLKPKLIPLRQDFVAPRDTPPSDLVAVPLELATNATQPGVAPEVVGFLREVQGAFPSFTATNYAGHGSGGFTAKAPGDEKAHSMGFSVDLMLSAPKGETDSRGFYQRDNAVEFLLALSKAADAAGAEWRVLYNDFCVAEEVNHTLGVERINFMGSFDKSGKINWHGPGPLILHFHLDIAPTKALSNDHR